MLSLWTRGRNPSPKPTPAALARLVPLAGRPLDEIARLVPLTTTQSLAVGTAAAVEEPGQVFLLQGKLRLTTPAGHSLLLAAEDARAGFPLPLQDQAEAVAVDAQADLLTLPRGALRRHPAAVPTPELRPAEADELNALRDYFTTANHDLPSLPDLAMKISTAIDRPDTDNEVIARLVQLDPVLSTRLLGVVNSAAMGGMTHITSISQAVARLGRRKVRSLVYSCLLKGLFRVPEGPLRRRMQALWQHAVHVAALSYVLGRATPGVDAEQALLAGLIHDIGAVAVIGGIAQHPRLSERDEVLDFVLASLRTEMGLRTLARWGLQNELGEVIRAAHDWTWIGSALTGSADVVLIARLHALIGTPQQAGLPRIDQVPAFAKLADGKLSPRASLLMLEEANADVRAIEALIVD